MNILLVTETYLPYITGVSVSTDNIARYMASRGHSVTIVCPKPVIVTNPPKKIQGLSVVYVPSFPKTFYNNNAIGIFPLGFPIIKKLIEKNKFDVIHIQEPVFTGITALILAKKFKIPTLGYLHFIPEQVDRVLWGSEKILTPILDTWVRFIYNQYHAVVAPSYFFANYLKVIGVKKDVSVISNGVDINKFFPSKIDQEFRTKYGISEKSVVFFYLGRLDGDKNVATLIKALPETSRSVHLLLIGQGKLSESLHTLAKRLRVDNKITWIDYITNSEMLNAYHSSNVFTIMSPYEGQSIVTLQAVASGLPIIAANAGALPELCHDDENGFLVDTYDYKTLGQKMNELAENKKLAEKFGKESRKISLVHHKPKTLHELETIYAKLKIIKGEAV